MEDHPADATVSTKSKQPKLFSFALLNDDRAVIEAIARKYNISKSDAIRFALRNALK